MDSVWADFGTTYLDLDHDNRDHIIKYYDDNFPVIIVDYLSQKSIALAFGLMQPSRDLNQVVSDSHGHCNLSQP